jgi:hypothetical protein
MLSLPSGVVRKIVFPEGGDPDLDPGPTIAVLFRVRLHRFLTAGDDIY